MAEMSDKEKKAQDVKEEAKVRRTPWSKLNLNKIPLNLVPLNRTPIRKITGLLNKVLPKNERRGTEKIINYLRIYTHLVNAYDMMNKYQYTMAFEHIIIVRNLTRSVFYREEKSYLDNISRIVRNILKKRRAIARRLKEYKASDPAHSKTNILLAQNICVLRILKIGKY